MSQIDCERFIRGANEINRKRRVITRVITTVEAILKKLVVRRVIKNHKWKNRQIVLKIPLGELTFVLVYNEGTLSGEIHDQEDKNHEWWGTVDYADAIPAWAVPIVYANLSEIVEKTAEKFPEAGIYQHFDFFSKQADA